MNRNDDDKLNVRGHLQNLQYLNSINKMERKKQENILIKEPYEKIICGLTNNQFVQHKIREPRLDMNNELDDEDRFNYHNQSKNRKGRNK